MGGKLGFRNDKNANFTSCNGSPGCSIKALYCIAVIMYVYMRVPLDCGIDVCECTCTCGIDFKRNWGRKVAIISLRVISCQLY